MKAIVGAGKRASAAPREAHPESLWLVDYITGFMKQPSWRTPIEEFVEQHFSLFAEEIDLATEQPHEHKEVHNSFRQLVEDLIMAHLLEVDASYEDLQNAAAQLDPKLIEQLVSIEDFATFRAMMLAAVRAHAKKERAAARLYGGKVVTGDTPTDDRDEEVGARGGAAGLSSAGVGDGREFWAGRNPSSSSSSSSSSSFSSAESGTGSSSSSSSKLGSPIDSEGGCSTVASLGEVAAPKAKSTPGEDATKSTTARKSWRPSAALRMYSSSSSSNSKSTSSKKGGGILSASQIRNALLGINKSEPPPARV